MHHLQIGADKIETHASDDKLMSGDLHELGVRAARQTTNDDGRAQHYFLRTTDHVPPAVLGVPAGPV